MAINPQLMSTWLQMNIIKKLSVRTKVTYLKPEECESIFQIFI